jgi:adenylate kinase
MNGRVVAVLGISGVGKTTMVSSFTDRHPWAHSVRASALLKEMVAVDDTEVLRTAPAPDIQSNQDLLAAAFRNLRRRLPDRHIIFDGHSLIDTNQNLVIVPAEIFEEIAPSLIVFIESNPETILVRRCTDVGRVRPQRTSEQISHHQELAREAALDYGCALSVPCKIIESGDSESFERVLLAAFEQHI